MAIDLSFIGRGVKPLNVGKGPIEDPTSEAAGRVAELLSTLGAMGVEPGFEPTPVPQPPQLPALPSGGQQIAGSIGDALMAMASIRAGGMPPAQGSFQTRLSGIQNQRMQLQQGYQNAVTEARSTDVAGRNRLRSMLGSVAMRPQSAAATKLNKTVYAVEDDQGVAHRYVRFTNPQTGEVVPTPNPETGELENEHDLGVAPQGYVLSYDQDGNAIWIKRPSGNVVGPSEPGVSGAALPGEAPTGKPGVIPVIGSSGKNVKKVPPANLVGLQQQLDNATKALDEMKENWLQRPKSGIMQGVGTAGANLLSRGMGAELGLSGLASAIDQHAVVHERDREALATMLAFPLTGSRRSVEGARKSLLDIIPHYTDPPEVWAVFEKQMRQIINNARRMPWGEQPNTSQDAYSAMLDALVAAAPGARPPTGAYSGITLPESAFDNANPGERDRFISGGGKVEP